MEASPVVLTSGSVFAFSAGVTFYNLAGENFSAATTGGGDFGGWDIIHNRPYHIGQTASINGVYSGLIGSGPGSYQGIDYPNVYWGVVFQFTEPATWLRAAAGLAMSVKRRWQP